jgi:hypothetical protein
MTDHMPGIPLIKDQLETNAPVKANVMDRELAALQDGAKVLPDQPKTQTIITTKL